MAFHSIIQFKIIYFYPCFFFLFTNNCIHVNMIQSHVHFTFSRNIQGRRLHTQRGYFCAHIWLILVNLPLRLFTQCLFNNSRTHCSVQAPFRTATGFSVLTRKPAYTRGFVNSNRRMRKQQWEHWRTGMTRAY